MSPVVRYIRHTPGRGIVNLRLTNPEVRYLLECLHTLMNGLERDVEIHTEEGDLDLASIKSGSLEVLEDFADHITDLLELEERYGR